MEEKKGFSFQVVTSLYSRFQRICKADGLPMTTRATLLIIDFCNARERAEAKKNVS